MPRIRMAPPADAVHIVHTVHSVTHSFHSYHRIHLGSLVAFHMFFPVTYLRRYLD
jgi:hypothetical protein